MKMIPFILLGVLCLGMGAVYTIFHKRTGWQAIVIRGLTIFSILILALVSANLKDLSNALPLFLILALALIIMQEVTLATESVDEKSRKIVYSTFAMVSNTLIAISAITFAEFHVLSVVGGLLTGIGIGLIISAIKKYKDLYSIITEVMVYASIGLFFGFAIMGILNAIHLISSILFLIGGFIMLVQSIINSIFSEKKDVCGYIMKALYILSLILVTMTIYFF